MKVLKINKRVLLNVTIGVSYLVLLGLFYILLPINDRLIGDFDTWGNLAMFKEILLFFEEIKLNTDYGSFLYPAIHTWIVYGLDFFTGLIWLFFYKLGINEVWSYWAYIVMLLASNSIGLYVFSKHFIKNKLIRWILGLLFSAHFFIYLTIDNPNIISYLFFFLALNQLFLFFKDRTWKVFLKFCLFAGVQIYASPAVFVFLFFTSSFLFFYNLKKESFNCLAKGLPGLGVLLILISPYIYIYMFQYTGLGQFTSLSEIDKIGYFNHLAFKFNDIFRLYPDHYLYNSSQDMNHRFLELKHLFPGFIIFGLFIASLFFKGNKQFHFLLLLGFLLGCGEYLYISESFELKSPFYIIYNYLGLTEILRNPSRFNMIVLLSYLLIVFQFLDQQFEKSKPKRKWLLLLLPFALLESCLYKKDLNQDSLYYKHMESNVFEDITFGQSDVILNIPIGSGAKKDSREMFYMYQRSFQKTNVVNGTQAINVEALKIPKLLYHFDFCSYLEGNNINVVLMYKDLVYDNEDIYQIRMVAKTSCLTRDKVSTNLFMFTKTQ